MSVLTRSSRFQRRSRSPRRSGQWDPSYLGLRALYDNRASSAAGMADRSGNGLADATVGAGSNSPLWLPYTTPNVYLPGVNGNYVSCPDAAAFDTTDLEIVCRVAMTDWTPGSNTALVGKLAAGSQSSYAFQVAATTGRLRLYLSHNGTTLAFAESSAAPTVSDGAWLWLKVTFRQSDLRTQFFTAADQESEPSSWTQLGTDITHTVAGAIYSSTSIVEIGTVTTGTNSPLDGRVGRAIIRTAIGGTAVADFNAALCTQSGYTDSLANVWTVNRATSGRKTVVQSPAAASARGVWLYGTDDYTDLPTTAIPAMALANAAEVLVVVRQWTTATSFGNYLSTRAAGAGQAGLAITSDGTSSTSLYGTISDGVATPTINATVAGAGVRNVIGLRRNTTTGLLHVNGVSGTSVSLAAVGATAGTTPRIGVRAGGSGYQDFEFEAFLSADRLLTAAELAQVVAFYGGGQ